MSETQDRLRAIAAASGARDARIIVLPTALIIAFGCPSLAAARAGRRLVGQVAGDRLFGGEVSGFVGALTMTPIALLVARVPGGPPSQVTFLPAFWLLVPSAIGLIGITEVVGNPASASIEDLVTPIGSIVAIALGVLAGASLFRGLAAPRRPR